MKKYVATFIMLMCFASPSYATIPTVDYTAIANQIVQIAKLVQQLKTMYQQVKIAQDQYNSMVGSRGMGDLLSGENRYYLPKDWNQTMSLLNTPVGGYDQLVNRIREIKASQAVLDDNDVNRLSPEARALLDRQRNNAATLKALGEAAYRQSSDRVALLQTLINKINTATDTKAIMDLQARIQCEQNMLTNDAEKLAAVSELQHSEDRALEQSAREMAIKSSGSSKSKMPSF